MHNVVFTSARATVQAENGENLLSLARRSHVLIDSSCGGNGSCHQCRVTLDAPEHFRDTQGRAVAPQHQREGKPIWLACRGGVFGPLVVEPAPLHGPSNVPSPSLQGWFVGNARPGDQLRVYDPETGTMLLVDTATGCIAAEGSGEAGDVVIGDEFSRADAAASGAGTPLPARVMDFGGMVVLAGAQGAQSRLVEASALAAGIRHQPGAIHWVEWSPLKTRTVIETWQGQPPLGLSAGGIVATVAALLQAGMADADGTLRPSRFVRDGASGPEVVLVGPAMEAVTPGGRVWTSAQDVCLTQKQVRAVLALARALRQAAAELGGDECRQVVSGPPGMALSRMQLQWLGFTDAEFIPWIVGLGAARRAAG